jgi:Fic family protein
MISEELKQQYIKYLNEHITICDTTDFNRYQCGNLLTIAEQIELQNMKLTIIEDKQNDQPEINFYLNVEEKEELPPGVK